MKNKKYLIIALPLLAMAMASCADTDPNNLFGSNEYISDFLKNVYSTWDAPFEQYGINNAASYAVDASKRFSGSGNSSNYYAGYGELKEKHPEAVLDDQVSIRDDGSEYYKELPWTSEGSDGEWAQPGDWVDQSEWEHRVWCQNKKLSRIEPSFKNGLLSKLYNGRILCNHWNSYAYIQLDQRGYGTVFPNVEINTSDYFAMTVRGGSNTYGAATGRIVSFDINVTFYKFNKSSGKFDGYTFAMDDCKMQANVAANYTALYGFYFSDFGFDPKGVAGMSMTYSIHDDSNARTWDETTQDYVPVSTSSDMSNPQEDQFYLALMLYEVFFPGSTWSSI